VQYIVGFLDCIGIPSTHIKVRGQDEGHLAGALAARVGLQVLRAGGVSARRPALGVVDDQLVGGVAQVQQDHANGYEEHPDHEECGQDGAGGEDGLPGGQALLLEGRICGWEWVGGAEG